MSDEKEDALRKQTKANLSPKGWEALLEGVERVSDAPVTPPSPEEGTQAAGPPERHILRVRDESGRVSEHVTSESQPRERSDKTASPYSRTYEPKGQAPTGDSRPESTEERHAPSAGAFGNRAAPQEGPPTLTRNTGFRRGMTDPGEGLNEPTSSAVEAGVDGIEESDQEKKEKVGLVGRWVQKQPLLQKLMLYYRGLSIRDQRLLLFTFIGLSLLFGYLVILEPMLDKKALLDRKVAMKKADLTEMARLRSSVDQDRGGMDRIKSIINQRGKDFSVFAYLEQLASKAEMKDKIVSIKPQRQTPVGQFKESLVSVKLDGIGMEELTRYLYQIETSEDLLYVKNLQIKKVSSNKGVGMNVTLSVGTLIQG